MQMGEPYHGKPKQIMLYKLLFWILDTGKF